MQIVDIKDIKTPLYVHSVQAGFPSPADDYIEKQLDFNDLLVSHPAATFCVKASGDSMIGAGIFPGDILVVDKSLKAANNSIVIAINNGEFTVKRLVIQNGKFFLMPENPAYNVIAIDSEGFEIWGVVTYVLHKAR